METHLKFRRGQQKLFITNVIQKSGLSTNDLAKIVHISPRNFRDWKNENVSIATKATLLLSNSFNVEIPEQVKILENRWKLNKAKAGKIGGIAYKKRHGNPGTYEGRKKGGLRTLKILRMRGIVPSVVMFHKPKFSTKLAEFIGIMLGDGSLGKLQISITLNSVKDLDYSQYVVNLCESLFGHKPKIRKRKNANALEIYFNGKNIVKILTSFGLIQGNKVKNQVGVPDWIKSNSKFKKVCLRGLMDTDGGVFIHRYKVNGKEYFYKKICFTNYSLPLLNFVYKTLKNLGFTPKIKDKVVNKKVWLYNSHEVEKYLTVIGSSNLRLNQHKQGGVA